MDFSDRDVQPSQIDILNLTILKFTHFTNFTLFEVKQIDDFSASFRYEISKSGDKFSNFCVLEIGYTYFSIAHELLDQSK